MSQPVKQSDDTDQCAISIYNQFSVSLYPWPGDLINHRLGENASLLNTYIQTFFHCHYSLNNTV